jgi:hypothetical protein
MAFDSRTPAAPPVIPGVTDTGEPPANPLEMLSQMMSAQPHLDEQKVQQAIMLLKSVQSPQYKDAVGAALRSLLSGPQAGSENGRIGGQSGQLVGPVSASMLSPMSRNP